MRRFLLILVILLMFLSIAFLIKAQQFHLTATVTVNPIYSLDIEIEILEKHVKAGENLSVLVELEKINLIGVEEEIAVRLDYKILKKDKIVEGYAGSLNVTNETEKIIEIPVSSDIKPGKYELKIKATHSQSYSDEDKDKFFIRRRWWKRWY